MRAALIATAALLAAGPALAQGDAAAGAREFNKCKSCHTVTAPDGTDVVKGGRTGPNLYGVIGRPAASVDFKYGAGLAAAGAQGLVWEATNFADYVVDPAKFLKAYLNDDKARSNMTFKLRKGAEDIAAWLIEVAPAPVPAE